MPVRGGGDATLLILTKARLQALANLGRVGSAINRWSRSPSAPLLWAAERPGVRGTIQEQVAKSRHEASVWLGGPTVFQRPQQGGGLDGLAVVQNGVLDGVLTRQINLRMAQPLAHTLDGLPRL